MARKAILIISGFTQKNHQNTGSKQLLAKCWKYGEMTAHGEETFVALKEWNYDWKAFAKFLNSLNVEEVFASCYSWGAGFGLREFAKYYNGNITAVLCDPVYRSKFWLTRWLALTRKLIPTIKYPANVRVVKHFKQTKNQPGNDKVKTFSKKPKAIMLPYTHTEIDNSKEYHQGAIEELEYWLFTNK